MSMDFVEIQVQQLDPQLPLPKYMTEGASGMDLFSAEKKSVILEPGATHLISTGLKIAIPTGYEIQVRPRSGLALKHGITMLNSPGTIDSDYRGVLSCIITNLGREAFEITYGMRIGQMVCQRVFGVKWKPVDQLDQTTRNEGGFGHTGHE